MPYKLDFKAGISEIKSWFGNDELQSGDYRGEDSFRNGNSGVFYMNEGGNPAARLFTFGDNYKSPLAAYQKCPPVAAIINRKAQAYVNGKTWVLTKSGKGAGKESSSAVANKVRSLFNNPNPLQTGKQFDAQVYGLVQLYGYAIVLLVKPVGFPNIDTERMYVLPNWNLTIYENTTPFFNKDNKVITKITFSSGGVQVDLPMDDIYIIKDLTPALSTVTLPESRIKALEMPINNVIGSYESRNTLINRRGPQGILTEDMNPIGNIPMTPSEKEELQRDFARYGLKEKQWRVILGKSPMKYVNMGYDMNELRLHEEAVESGIAICNGLSYPPFLLGLTDSTFNNQKEASTGLYMETTIPEAENIYEQYDTMMGLSGNNLQITKDYSHVSALQEDRQKAATARKTASESYEREFKNNVITLNAWRVGIDQDPMEGEEGNMLYHELLSLGWTFGNTTGQVATSQQSA